MPKSLDMFSSGGSATIDLSHGQSHLVQTKKVSAAKKQEHQKDQLQKLSHQPIRRSRPFLRELRRMAALSIIAFLLLWTGSTIGDVRSFQTESLEKEQNRILSEVRTLQNISVLEEASKTQLQKLQETLRSSHLALDQYKNTNTEALLVTGFQSSTALLQAAAIATELGLLAEEQLAYWQQQFPLIFNGEISLLDIISELEALHHEVLQKTLQIEKRIETALQGPIPDELSAQLSAALSVLAKGHNWLEEIERMFPALRKLAGEDHHTIGVMLQNRNELRATGGFLGNLLLIEMLDGHVVHWEIRDIFEYSGQMTIDIPVRPEFAHLTGVQTVHDCNVYPDFAESAQYCISLLEYAKAPTIDTLVGVDNGLLEKILESTGSVALPNAENIALRAENVSFVLSYLIEAHIFQENGAASPKTFLNELLPVLQEKMQLLPIETLEAFARETWKAKYVQIYSRDPDLQNMWSALHLDGSFIPEKSNTDFVGVIHENVGGNKSDAFVVQNIAEKTLLNSAGEMFHTLTIQRQHTWSQTAENAFEALYSRFGTNAKDRESLRQILGGGDNLAFTTVYMPKGTQLQQATYGETALRVQKEEHSDATAFSFFFPTLAAGEEATVELFFKSPLSVNTEHGEQLEFTALAQAGSQNTIFSKEFLLESGVRLEGEEISEEEWSGDIERTYIIE